MLKQCLVSQLYANYITKILFLQLQLHLQLLLQLPLTLLDLYSSEYVAYDTNRYAVKVLNCPKWHK